MIDYLRQLPIPARSVLLTAMAVLLGVVISVLSWVGGEVLTYVGTLDQTKPRIGRLLGYIEQEDGLRAARNQVSRKLEALAYTGDADANQVGAQLQQALRGFAEDAGLNVSGSQLLKRSDKESFDGFDLMFVELNMVGNPEAVDGFLALVDQHTPVLRVDEIVLSEQRQKRRASRRGRTADNDDSEEDLLMQITVSALRVAEQ